MLKKLLFIICLFFSMISLANFDDFVGFWVTNRDSMIQIEKDKNDYYLSYYNIDEHEFYEVLDLVFINSYNILDGVPLLKEKRIKLIPKNNGLMYLDKKKNGKIIYLDKYDPEEDYPYLNAERSSKGDEIIRMKEITNNKISKFTDFLYRHLTEAEKVQLQNIKINKK